MDLAVHGGSGSHAVLGWGDALLDTDVTQVRWELFERLKALGRLQFR